MLTTTDTRPDSVINCCPNCESRPNYSEVQDVTILDCGDRFCMSCETRWTGEDRVVIPDLDYDEGEQHDPDCDPVLCRANPCEAASLPAAHIESSFPVCDACAELIGGACAGPDAEWRHAEAGEPCGAADHQAEPVAGALDHWICAGGLSGAAALQ